MGTGRELLDVNIPSGAGNFNFNAGDLMLRLREVPIEVDETTFVRDVGTDALEQTEYTEIGSRKRFENTYGFPLRSQTGYVGHGTWEYDPSDNIDISEMNYLLFMIRVRRGYGFETEDGGLSLLGEDPAYKIEIEDDSGNTKYWEFYRKDLTEEFNTVIAYLKTYPNGGSGISSFDENSVSKIRFTIYGSSTFYETYDGSDSIVTYVEKCILGGMGLQVKTEIRELDVDVDVKGVLSETVAEQRFTGDNVTTDFSLHNTAERILEAQTFEDGTWADSDAELVDDGETVRFDTAPGTDIPVRVLYNVRYVSSGDASTKEETLFTDETLDDAVEHTSSVFDLSKYRNASVYLKFHTEVGAGASQIKVRIYAGNDTVQGEAYYWDITDIAEDDEIVIPLPDTLSSTHIKVSLENEDGDPTSNYYDVDGELFGKS